MSKAGPVKEEEGKGKLSCSSGSSGLNQTGSSYDLLTTTTFTEESVD
jgi:hypothetical protein